MVVSLDLELVSAGVAQGNQIGDQVR